MKGEQLRIFNPNRIRRTDLDINIDRILRTGGDRLKQLTREGRCEDMADKKPETFGDLKTPQFEVEDYVKQVDLLDQPIIVEDIMTLTGDKGPYLTVKARFPKGTKSIGFSCGSIVVMKKMLQAKEEGLLPLPGKIVKVPGKDYYDIIGPDEELNG